MRPPTAFSKHLWEMWARATGPPLRGGAKVPRATPKLHTLPHHQRPLTTATHPPQPTGPHPLISFARLIADGTFKSLRTKYSIPHGPYTSSRLGPRPCSFAQGFATRASARPSARKGFGPSPRPVVPSFAQSNMGLGAARGFASGQTLFGNVVANAPLALRALANEGIDERKWKKVTREVRRKERTVVKGQGRHGGQLMSIKDEFGLFFTAPAPVAPAFAPVGGATSEEQVEERLPVVLVISVEPSLSFPPPSTPNTADDFDPYTDRLLPPSVLSTFSSISTAYTTHAHRIRALHHRLLKSGVWEDPTTTCEAISYREWDGRERKEVVITFGPKWTRGDVLSAVGGWEKEETWWSVVDLEEERRERERESSAMSATTTTTSFSSWCAEDDHRASTDSDHIHELVASTFVLPSLDLVDSLTESTTSSSFYSHSPPPASESNWDDSTWSRSLPGLSIGEVEDDGHAWAEVEEEEGEVEHSEWQSSASSYEEGVQDFLFELDALRMREGTV